MLAVGLAVDYALLMVSRFREERADRTRRAGARSPRTAATAGRTVLFSGLTVAVALAGLLVFPDPFLRSMGLAGVGGRRWSTWLAALTLLPALLALVGRRITPAKPRTGGRACSPASPAVVQRRPGADRCSPRAARCWCSPLPVLDLRLVQGDAAAAAGQHRRPAQLYDALAAHFPDRGAAGPDHRRGRRRRPRRPGARRAPRRGSPPSPGVTGVEVEPVGPASPCCAPRRRAPPAGRGRPGRRHGDPRPAGAVRRRGDRRRRAAGRLPGDARRPAALGGRAGRARHAGAAVPVHRFGAAAGQGGADQPAQHRRRARRRGLGVPAGPPGRTGSAPRAWATRTSPSRCWWARSRSGCPSTTRCSCCPGSGNGGSPAPAARRRGRRGPAAHRPHRHRRGAAARGRLRRASSSAGSCPIKAIGLGLVLAVAARRHDRPDAAGAGDHDAAGPVQLVGAAARCAGSTPASPVASTRPTPLRRGTVSWSPPAAEHRRAPAATAGARAPSPSILDLLPSISGKSRR